MKKTFSYNKGDIVEVQNYNIFNDPTPIGWNDNAYGLGKPYVPHDEFVFNSSLNIFAQYNHIHIHYFDISSDKSVYDVAYENRVGNRIEIPSSFFDDSNFICWNTTDNTILCAGQFINLKYDVSACVSCEYTVSLAYELNGGNLAYDDASNSYKTLSTYYGKAHYWVDTHDFSYKSLYPSVVIPLNIFLPPSDEFIFIGWQIGNKLYLPNSRIELHTDAIAYAIWRYRLKYYITTASVPLNAGVINVLGNIYDDKKTCVATPNEEYIFDYWDGDSFICKLISLGQINPTCATIEIQLTSDDPYADVINHKLIAHFKKRIKYKLNASVNNRLYGSVTGSGTSYSNTFNCQAIPNDGYIFDFWSGNELITESIKNNANITLTLSELAPTQTIVANFKVDDRYTTFEYTDGSISKKHIVGSFSYQDINNRSSYLNIDYSIKKITFGSSVTNIKSYACYSCRSLTHVEFKNRVTINSFSFAYSLLETFDFAQITNSSIPIYAFECTKLTNIESINNNLNIKTIEAYAFAYCNDISSIRFVNITHINTNAFMNCEKLANVDFTGYSLVLPSIEEYAFGVSLENLLIRLKSTTESLYAYNDDNWKYYYPCIIPLVPMTLVGTKIKIKRFSNCFGTVAFRLYVIPYDINSPIVINWGIDDKQSTITNLKSEIYNKIESPSIYPSLKINSSAYTIDISDNVKAIGFIPTRVKIIDIVQFGHHVSELKEEAFYNQTQLESLIIPLQITYIGKSILNGCKSLSSLIIEDGEYYQYSDTKQKMIKLHSNDPNSREVIACSSSQCKLLTWPQR